MLGHRFVLSTDAELSDVRADDVVDRILEEVSVTDVEPNEIRAESGDGEDAKPEEFD